MAELLERLEALSKEGEGRSAIFEICALIKGYGTKSSDRPLSKDEFSQALGYIETVCQSVSFVDIRDAAVEASLSYPYRTYLLFLKNGRKPLNFVPFQDDELKRASVQFTQPHNGVDVVVANLRFVPITISSVRFEKGLLVIDASVPPELIWGEGALSWKVRVGGKFYELEQTGQYRDLALFGVYFLREACFRVVVDTKELPSSSEISFWVEYSREGIQGRIPAQHKWKSRAHLSPSKRQYWIKDGVCFDASNRGVKLSPATRGTRLKKELRLWLALVRYGRDALFLRAAYWITKPFMRRRVWIFHDKPYMAGDSGELMCRYVLKHAPKDVRPVFILGEGAEPIERLRQDGFEIVIRQTLKHKLLHMHAEVMWATHTNPDASVGLTTPALSTYMRDFLQSRIFATQHFIAMQDVASLIAQGKVGIERYYCASHYEAKHLATPKYGYVPEQLPVTGSARFDDLYDRSDEVGFKQLLLSPTWRPDIAMRPHGKGKQRKAYSGFKDSAYFEIYNSLLQDERLIAAAEKAGYRIVLLLHPCIASNKDSFPQNETVRACAPGEDGSYEDFLCESKLMVTDYSGVQYDFAYMNKPVVYLHSPQLPPYYENEAMDYETMGFGEVTHTVDELVDVLLSYLERDCEPSKETLRRISDFFDYQDHSICERIYEDATEYLARPIPNKVLAGSSAVLPPSRS